MYRPLDRLTACRRLALFLLALVVCLPALAQNSATETILEALEDRYEILELSRGYLLRPTDGHDDFRGLEVQDGQIAVDGVEIEAEALRRYVDDDADLILALAGLAELESPQPPEAPEPPAGPEEDWTEVEAEDAEDWVEVVRDRRRHRSRDDTRVSFGTPVTIQADESVNEVVLLLGRLDVRGEVDGDATVVGGSADVTGQIDGSLVVVGGSAHLGPEAVIDGDVVTVGGSVRREAGAVIDGEVIQVDIGEHLELGDVRIDTPGLPSFGSPFGSVWDFVGNIFGILFLLLLLTPFLFIAPQRTRAVGARAVHEPWKAGLVGVVVEILFLPLLLLAFVVLMVSIVGIPLILVVIPLLVLALGLYFLMGMAGVSMEVGRLLDGRFSWGTVSPYWLLLIGVLGIQCWALLGDLLAFLPWPIRISAVLLILLGLLIEYVAWTVGLGAAVLQQFSPRTVDGAAVVGSPFADPYQPPPRAPESDPLADLDQPVSERPDPEDQGSAEGDDEQFER